MPATSVTWGFRVASRPEDGQGHLARCRAVAAAMAGPVRLFLDAGVRDPDAGDDRLVREPASDRCRALLAAADDDTIDAALIDGYRYGDAEVASVAARVFTAAFADDGRARGEALGIAAGFAPPPEGNSLAGPEFAPLAPDFRAAHERALARRAASVDGRVLIAFGARDSGNLTASALAAAAGLAAVTRITVIMGAVSPHRATIAEQAASIQGAKLVIGPETLIPHYEAADVAIGAPGVSLLERLCCGLPSIVMCQNERQRPAAQAAADHGCAVLVGDDPAELGQALDRMLRDANRRVEIRRRGLQAVDGRGAERLARALERALAGRNPAAA